VPVHELGYRAWSGPLTGPWLRWLAITRTGIALGLRSKLLRRLMFLTVAPLFYFGPLFFAVALVTDPGFEGNAWSREVVQEFLGQRSYAKFVDDPNALRAEVWSVIFVTLQSYFQLVLCLVVTAIVAPPLVSRDVRSKAFLIYFSKPITRADYLVGKAGVAIAFLFWFTLLPALLLYLLSIAFAPSIDVVAQTAGMVPKIVAASLTICVPLATIALFLSSLTRDERFAAFGWILLLVFGEIAFQALDLTSEFHGAQWLVMFSLRKSIVVALSGVYDAVSIFDQPPELMHRIGEPAFSTPTTYSSALAFAWLAFLSAAAVTGLLRRVSAPTRI
jgi:ABC-type transport system involved in multi-copper enzyme maturation permease subunit